MLHTLLKTNTSEEHDQLERLMDSEAIMSGTLDIKSYEQLLLSNYTIHMLYEELIFSQLSPETRERLSIDQREKTSLLLDDLEELGTTPALISSLKQSDVIYDEASALGAMYVLEGSTLGGSVISRKLKQNEQEGFGGLTFRFYESYGKDLGSRWKDFLEVLNEVPEQAWDNSLKAAKFMFNELRNEQQKRKAVAP